MADFTDAAGGGSVMSMEQAQFTDEEQASIDAAARIIRAALAQHLPVAEDDEDIDDDTHNRNQDHRAGVLIAALADTIIDPSSCVHCHMSRLRNALRMLSDFTECAEAA
jgi:hypothetical protein